MPTGLEPILVGGGIILLSLLAATWADHEVPKDRSGYDWAWVQGRRWPGLVGKYFGVPLGALFIAFGLVVLLVGAVS